MTNLVRSISDNMGWIFDGIGVFVLGILVGLVGFYFGRWQKRGRLTIAPKKFSPANDLIARCGRTNLDTLRVETYHAKLGVNPASLETRCYNLTATPIILDKVRLLNADSGEEVVRQDAKAQRIDAHSSGAVDIRIGTTDAPCYQTPTWRGQITLETVGKKSFSSSPFNFRDFA